MSVDKARKFVSEVSGIAKKYRLDYFIVTEGASGYSSSHNNDAIKIARENHTKWEKKHGHDPDEDWSENINEATSLIPEITLYHASTKKLNIIKPQGLDFGNKLRKPGWSTFCWNNYEYAKGWALFKIIWEERKHLKTLLPKSEFEFEFDIRVNKPIATPELAEIIYDKYIGKQAYIHTFRSPINDISLGNTSTMDEYTIRHEVKPIKIDSFVVNKSILDEYLVVASADDINKYFEDFSQGKYNGNRGLIKSKFMNFSYSDEKYRSIMKRVTQDYKNGVISIGDDINHYFEDTECTFNPDDFSFMREESLGKLKEIKVSNDNIEKYSEDLPTLKHLRCDDDYEGIILLNKTEIIGIVNANTKDKIIQALFVDTKYRNEGVGTKLIDIAVTRLKCNKLTVRKTNSTAIQLYKKYGFKIIKTDDYQYTMKI